MLKKLTHYEMLSCLFTGLCVLLTLQSSAQRLTEMQKMQLEETARAFFSAIELCSNSNDKGESPANQIGRILAMKDSYDPQELFANDLFWVDEELSEDHIWWSTYFESIASKFRFQLEVNFIGIKIIDCIVHGQNGNYAIIKTDKSLKYKNREKTTTLLVFINLSNFKVKEVIFAKYYNQGYYSCSKYISNWIDRPDIQDNYRRQAFTSFQNAEFSKAKVSYNEILNLSPNDAYILNRIQECDAFIKSSDLLAHADSLLLSKNYETALLFYSKLLNEEKRTSGKDSIQSKISLCKTKIQELKYNTNIVFADEAFTRGKFDQARRFYELALQYKSGDSYAQMKLNESKNGDPFFAMQEINRAVLLAERNQRSRKFGEAFKILLEYESTDLLTIDNYYFLVNVMNGISKDNKDIRDVMNLDKRDCLNYLNIFCKKLREAAQNETNISKKQRVEQLLFDINKRHQN